MNEEKDPNGTVEEPTEPTEPMEPTEPTEPTEPMEPTEPRNDYGARLDAIMAGMESIQKSISAILSNGVQTAPAPKNDTLTVEDIEAVEKSGDDNFDFDFD